MIFKILLPAVAAVERTAAAEAYALGPSKSRSRPGPFAADVHDHWRRAGSQGLEPGRDGRERTHIQQHAALDRMTLCGKVRCRRPLSGVRKASQLSPHDAALNLPADSFSFVARKEVALQAIQTSFDPALVTIKRTTAAHVAERWAEDLVVHAAVDFDACYYRCAFGVSP